jgi:HEAT repeat protein
LASDPGDRQLRSLRLRLLVATGRRGEAVALCRQLGGDRLLWSLADSVLWWSLRHPDPTIRVKGIHAARDLDAKTLLDEMRARLDDPDEVVRTWAAVALSGTPRGANLLEQQLRSESPAARAHAFRELGRLAREAAVAPLAACVEDPVPQVRAACAAGLGRTGHQTAWPSLRRLSTDAEREVRRAAVAALGHLRLPRSAEILRRATEDDYLAVRLAAVTALAGLEDDQPTALLRRLAEGGDSLTALRAGVQLARRGLVQPGLNAIARGLVHRSPATRIAAINAASSVADRVARRLVRRALRDPQPPVRLAAARALFQTDPAAALRVAKSVHELTGTQPGMAALRIEAAELLTRSGDLSGRQTLEHLAGRAKAPADRQSALRAALRHTSAKQLALAALADPDPRVALVAATWLYRTLR